MPIFSKFSSLNFLGFQIEILFNRNILTEATTTGKYIGHCESARYIRRVQKRTRAKKSWGWKGQKRKKQRQRKNKSWEKTAIWRFVTGWKNLLYKLYNKYLEKQKDLRECFVLVAVSQMWHLAHWVSRATTPHPSCFSKCKRYIKGAKNKAIIVKSGEDPCFSRCSYKWTNCQSEHFPRTCGWFQIFQWYFWWIPRKRRRNAPTSLEIQLFRGIVICIFFFIEIILENSGEKTLGYCNTMVSKIFRFICSWTWQLRFQENFERLRYNLILNHVMSDFGRKNMTWHCIENHILYVILSSIWNTNLISLSNFEFSNFL